MPPINRQVRLAARPSGRPTAADRYPRARAELADWLRAGQLVSREHIVRGSVHDFPDVLLMLFEGANTGKLILALDS